MNKVTEYDKRYSKKTGTHNVRNVVVIKHNISTLALIANQMIRISHHLKSTDSYLFGIQVLIIVNKLPIHVVIIYVNAEQNPTLAQTMASITNFI